MHTVIQSEPVTIITVVQKAKFRTLKTLIIPAGLYVWGKM